MAVNITEKTSPVLTCTADCSPPCNITWYKDGKIIESNGRNKDLKINRIAKTHSGTYKCQAAGVAGQTSFSSELRVRVHCKYLSYISFHSPVCRSRLCKRYEQAKIMNRCQFHKSHQEYKIKKRANTNPLIYQRWEDVSRKSKHPC